MLSPHIRPIGLDTPTAAVLTQMMRCLADGACPPRTIWMGCPWHCCLSMVSRLQGWRARYLLGLPPLGASTSGPCAVPLPEPAGPPSLHRLPDLKLEWPTDCRTEIVRVYILRDHPAATVIMPGAMFDLLI